MDEEVKEILGDIRKWTKVLAQDKIREDLQRLSNEEKVVYELSTSDRGHRDIASIEGVDVSHMTVSNWRRSWFQQGLMEQINIAGGTRYVRLDSLENFGIDVPEIEEEPK